MRNLEKDLFVGPCKAGGVRPLRVEQCEITRANRGVAPVLAHAPFPDTCSQEKNVVLAMRNVGRRTP